MSTLLICRFGTLIGVYDDARREEHLHGPKHKARQMVFQHILPGARSQQLDNMASQKDDKSTRRAARSGNRGGSPWPRRQGMKDSQPAGQKKLPQQRLPRCGPPFGLGTGRVSLEPASDSWNGRSPRERSCRSLRPGQISARPDAGKRGHDPPDSVAYVRLSGLLAAGLCDARNAQADHLARNNDPLGKNSARF